MLFPILQAAWQQIGPQAAQFVNSPAFLQLIGVLRSVPYPVYAAASHAVSENVSDWYQNLSPEEKNRLKEAAIWAAKDMAGDVTAAVTGLPIGPLVDLGVEKLFTDEKPPK